jgi:hypothetical protein
VQKVALVGLFSLQLLQVTGCLLLDSLKSSFTVLRAFCISLAAVWNAFSISNPIFEKASLQSSVGAGTPASTPRLVLKPHLVQKFASSGSFSLQWEQKTMNIAYGKQLKRTI